MAVKNACTDKGTSFVCNKKEVEDAWKPSARGYLLVSDGVEAGRFDLLGVAMETHVTEHHHCAEKQGGGVGQIQPCNIRGSTVDLQGAMKVRLDDIHVLVRL